MTFEEWWEVNGRPEWDSTMAKAAYRAGLLAAAEQDEQEAIRLRKIWDEFISSKAAGPASDYSNLYAGSAAMHRKAAEELK